MQTKIEKYCVEYENKDFIKKEKLVCEQTSPYKPYHHENFLNAYAAI